MRKIISILLVAGITLGAMAKSDKRGVSENNFQWGSQLEALEPGVSWYYNWGPAPGAGMSNQVIDFEGIEFVPMCWNGGYDAEKIRNYCKTHPRTKYLLGFNEPNFKGQANMTPQQAAEAWVGVKALADELGLKLVAPALNYSPDAPYYQPTDWMDEFVSLVGLDAFDFTAIHNYGGLGVMQDLATKFHDRYGKDVWVTEFCYWPGESGAVAVDTQIGSMVETVLWLESTPWIYRYAWFKATKGNNASTNFYLVDSDGSVSNPWILSEQGKVYVHLGTCDTEVWHKTGKTVLATEISERNLASFGSSNDTASGAKLDLTRFVGGASATWQFEVEEAGEYYIQTSMSGFGEPTRFDPKLQWVIIDGETETPITDVLAPSLPNNETDYIVVEVPVSLPAGKMRLRLKDMSPYQPSGMTISAVRIDKNAAGVESVGAETGQNGLFSGNIYNLQGVRVGEYPADVTRLPKGLYIINGKVVAL